MKRFTKSTQQKMSMEYKKNVPAKINNAFVNRRVDAAFISSITAKKSLHVDLGIISKKKVKSVIVIPSKSYKKDKESASSNILAQLLHVKGTILIGDKALRYALKHDDYIDLAELWYDKHNLPFVFALLCYHKDKNLYKKIQREFLKKKVKIPGYLLQKAAKRTGISESEILEYLTLISYKLDTKAKKGLKKFYTQERELL